MMLADVACPPSPEKPRVPLPATVVMIPFGATLRMRALSAMNRLPCASTAMPVGTIVALVAGMPSPL